MTTITIVTALTSDFMTEQPFDFLLGISIVAIVGSTILDKVAYEDSANKCAKDDNLEGWY